jgi:hypothetical protein
MTDPGHHRPIKYMSRAVTQALFIRSSQAKAKVRPKARPVTG